MQAKSTLATIPEECVLGFSRISGRRGGGTAAISWDAMAQPPTEAGPSLCSSGDARNRTAGH